jgi:multidrug efflux system membrane fusion protein
MSVSFREGEAVRAGQVIAVVDSAALKAQLDAMQSQLARDKNDAERGADQERLMGLVHEFENARNVTAPIAGVAGLRMIEPGNVVHPGEGIVTIAQIQPIAVLFTLQEDFLSKVRSHMGEGAGPMVEAWNRDNSVKLATGHLTAMDNQIDEKTGTVKLKAMFDNKDSALFPNQFVNVRLLVQ